MQSTPTRTLVSHLHGLGGRGKQIIDAHARDHVRDNIRCLRVFFLKCCVFLTSYYVEIHSTHVHASPL